MIYRRKSPMSYLVKNEVSQIGADGKRLISEPVFIRFMQDDPTSFEAMFDTAEYAGKYVDTAVKANRIEPGRDAEAKTKEIDKSLQSFIEKHDDFKDGLIWKHVEKKEKPKPKAKPKPEKKPARKAKGGKK